MVISPCVNSSSKINYSLDSIFSTYKYTSYTEFNDHKNMLTNDGPSMEHIVEHENLTLVTEK